jgi:hypothetical protein
LFYSGNFQPKKTRRERLLQFQNTNVNSNLKQVIFILFIHLNYTNMVFQKRAISILLAFLVAAVIASAQSKLPRSNPEAEDGLATW